MTDDGLVLESIRTLEWRLTDALVHTMLQYLWAGDRKTVDRLAELYFEIRAALAEGEVRE